MEELYKTEYMILITDGFEKVVIKKMDKKSLSDSEKEICSIFKLSMNIFDELETLNFIPNFLANVPLKESLDEYLVDEYKYLVYHIENHIIRVISVLDKCSLLISELYDLDIKDERCSCSKIIYEFKDHLSVKTYKYLNQFYINTRYIREIRNHFIHRGKFHDEKLNKLSDYAFLNRRGNKDLITDNILREIQGFNYFDYFCKLTENNKVIFNYLTLLFNSLVPKLKGKITAN